MKCYNEAAAYATLKDLQGRLVPFCYGAWHIEDEEDVSLLEQIDGKTLSDRLSKMDVGDKSAAKDVHQSCCIAITCLHSMGQSHSKKLDKVGLRTGFSEQELKECVCLPYSFLTPSYPPPSSPPPYSPLAPIDTNVCCFTTMYLFMVWQLAWGAFSRVAHRLQSSRINFSSRITSVLEHLQIPERKHR